MAKVNWEKIKTEYITTDTSHKKLAEKYKLNATTISNRSRQEGWVDLRKKYKSETLAKALGKSAEIESDRLAKLMETATKAIDVAVSAIEDEKQFNRFLVNRHEVYLVPELQEDGVTAVKEKSWTEELVLKKLDTKALKEYTTVLKDLTTLIREFTNAPTPAQAEAQRIAAERLELDKQKANVDKGPKEPITVIFGGDIDKYTN